MCVGACMHGYVPACMCAYGACLCASECVGVQVCTYVYFSFAWNSLSMLEWLAREPQGVSGSLLFLSPQHWDCKQVQPYPAFYPRVLGIELRSLYFHSKHFTNRAISPTPRLFMTRFSCMPSLRLHKCEQGTPSP